jgi:hypothetical protein
MTKEVSDADTREDRRLLVRPVSTRRAGINPEFIGAP